MRTIFVTDTTFWIDYYGLESLDEPSRKNVATWFETTLNNGEARIVLTTVILCEIIRRLFYIKKMDVKKIKTITRSLRKSFSNVIVADFTNGSLHDIVELLDRLPSNIQCDIGEMSLLSELKLADSVLVSSDKNALYSYKFVGRLNPRIFPHIVTPAGNEIK